MKKNIIFDCDEVLLSTSLSLSYFLNNQGYKCEPYSKYPSQWSCIGGDWKKLEEFTQNFVGSSYFENVEPITGARESLTKLRSMGYSFSVVTSISSNPVAQEKREYNLKSVFGDVFDKVICLPLGVGNKKDQLMAMPPSFFLDDSFQNIVDAKEAGHFPFLLMCAMNDNDVTLLNQNSGIKDECCGSWKDFTALVESFETNSSHHFINKFRY